tara:strand:+ start:140 stop:340 length:201 start_codon:yes stop_codon:yes gene_type:complete
MKTEWDVDESLCIFCKKHWKKVEISLANLFSKRKRYVKCDIYDMGSNHYDDQTCFDCYEKALLGKL